MHNKPWIKVFLVLIAAWFFIFLMDMMFGYDAYMRSEMVKFPAKVHPEQNEVYERNGQRYSEIYIGGIRFNFPYGYTFNKIGSASDPNGGVDIKLYWPNIPPGKVADTKFKKLEEKPSSKYLVVVQVRGTVKPIDKSKSKITGLPYNVNPEDYIIRDDLEFGYRTFIPKSPPNLVMYIYQHNGDAEEPWGREPVFGYMHFSYAPQISVRIIVMGRTENVNPDWKGIYLGVVETLNKYRQDKQ
jgi:hypothetical protein